MDLSDKRGFPERYRGALITANGFAIIGQKPVRGRDFAPQDEQPGAPPVVLLGYGLWESRYGADPAVIGTTIRVNDIPAMIVGVMPRGVTFPGASSLWMPIARTPDTDKREVRNLTVFGRLAPHATLASARSELSTIAQSLSANLPDHQPGRRHRDPELQRPVHGKPDAAGVRSLLGAVAFLLLIACANVANLLLARAVSRSREVSIRTALGASRWRVIRQLLIESLLLALAASVVGYLAGIAGVRVFDAALVPAVKPPYVDFSIDGAVIAYLAAVTAAATDRRRACAGAAALHRRSHRRPAGRHERRRHEPALRVSSALLVVTEVSLAVVLLAGAGLMIRSLLNTSRAEIGVNTANVLSTSVNLRTTKYPKVEDQVAFHDRLKSRLESLPGIEAVGIASEDLPAESPDDFAYEIDGAPRAESGSPATASGLTVGPDYFRTLAVTPRAGRAFGEPIAPAACRSPSSTSDSRGNRGLAAIRSVNGFGS